MKKTIVLISVVILSAAFTISKSKQFIPPGTVNINDTLFVDETEISNLSWLEYVQYNKTKFGVSSNEYLSSLPDTTVWRQKMSCNEPYVNYYFRHPAYKQYPVVGVSYEQALAYCKWRTERVHIALEIKEGKRKAEDSNKEYTGKFKFGYRLPTKQEWEAMAMPGLDKVNKEKADKTKSPLYNSIVAWNYANTLKDNADVTAPTKSYWPNKLGIYNAIGNVSELVAEKGIAKGGNWRTYPEKLNIWNDEVFEKSNAWTGFRCVCVVKK
ncbi:MAG: SUMF1/EgtB/PvdO family nonheme iron enzyme [Bacteroidota bacterium]|nr:SUMF1/EgtB/PvdO family nonheme iron enzyme [Bacteroidota bacterium]